MLRALLRRSQRQRKRAIVLARKGEISSTRQEHLDHLAAEAKRKGLSAAKIQAMKRRWDARVLVTHLRKVNLSALKIQATWRGLVGRRYAHEERMKLLRVVPTKYQMAELKKRCMVLSRFGAWQELRDPRTNHIFFYHTPTGDSQWDPPPCDDTGIDVVYRCTYEDCTEEFENILALEQHRAAKHRWMCPACFFRNKIDIFPVCEACGNEKGGSGKRLTVEYEEKWETNLVLTEYKEARKASKTTPVIKNTLLDLRPQSATDSAFLDIRRRVLNELKTRPGYEQSLREEGVVPEWPAKQAQKGPMSKHAYERKRRKDQTRAREKKKAALALKKKLQLLRPSTTGGVLGIKLGKSNVDKHIRDMTNNRPITPSILSNLDGITLHKYFEEKVNEEGEWRAQEREMKLKNAADVPMLAVTGPGSMDTDAFSKLRDHLQSAEGQMTSLDLRNNDGIINSTILENEPQIIKKESIASPKSASLLPSIHKIKTNERLSRPSTVQPLTSTNMSSIIDSTEMAPNIFRHAEELDFARPHTAPVKIGDLKRRGEEVYKNLIRKGQGTRTFSSGAKYVGSLLSGTMDGHGVMTYSNRDVYVGQWKAGYRHGHGIFRGHDGKVYEGIWVHGMRHGKGNLKHPNGEEYVGEWEYGKMCGYGTLKSANGDVYEGKWLNSKYHGIGKFTKANGHIFMGTCKNGKANGKGFIRYSTGETYKGLWKDDRRHGKGIGTFSNGARYIGDWERGRFNGQGKFVQPNGEIYAGNWFMGRRDGYGKAIFSNGDVYVGRWERDRVLGKGVMFYKGSGNLYDGMWNNGMRNGLGVLKLKNGGIFKGFFKDGSIHGRGIFNYGNGDQYKGQFDRGHKDGKGIFSWANGNKYNGFFKDDKLDGQGEMNYAVGHRYIGEWKNGKKDGFGKLYYNDGNLYIGCWDSDQRHGKGKFIWNRMLKSQMEFYDGEWVNDRKEGFGLYKYKNGSTYEGKWVNGVREGTGIFQYPDGSYYNGDFVNDKRNGNGKYVAQDGTNYTGDWNNGVMEGNGCFIKANGDKYEGEFLSGKKHGDGVITYADGNIYIGQWREGRRYGHGQYLYQAREKDLNNEEDDFATNGILRMNVYGY